MKNNHIDTSKLQRVLDAISEHAAALSNELAEIDKEYQYGSCDECGKPLTEKVVYTNDITLFKSWIECTHCGLIYEEPRGDM